MTKRLCKTLILLIISSLPILCEAQPNLKIPVGHFRSPIDFPILLSANFGELRTNHFHAGLDFKTMGVIGKNIYAIDSGYVSRIKISPWGYGYALYVTHYNGYTSVYGHLDSFSPKIEKFTKMVQNQKKSFDVDIYPGKTQLVVRKGEVIGKSGNTGSSGGPHLHFEIRETESEIAVNPMLFGFDIKDNIKPVIKRLYVYNFPKNEKYKYNCSPNSFKTAGRNGKYTINKTIETGNYIAFGIETADYLNGSHNVCGIYEIKLFVNDTMIYYFKLDKVDFFESRYINSHIDYKEKIKNRTKIHKLYKDANNRLSNYVFIKNDGFLSVPDNMERKIKIEVSDTYGNLSELNFTIQKEKETDNICAKQNCYSVFVPMKINTIKDSNLSITIPKGALYDTICFQYHKEDGHNDVSFMLHNPETPLHYPVKIEYKLDDSLKTKRGLLFIRKYKNRKFALESQIEDNVIIAETDKFGYFYITQDTLPPSVRNYSFGADSTRLKNKTIRFRITDNLSGISKYNAYIDNKWLLMNFDGKTAKLSAYIDKESLLEKKYHHFLLIVEDAVGNKTRFETNFSL